MVWLPVDLVVIVGSIPGMPIFILFLHVVACVEHWLAWTARFLVPKDKPVGFPFILACICICVCSQALVVVVALA